jgi:hypothetical protein
MENWNFLSQSKINVNLITVSIIDCLRFRGLYHFISHKESQWSDCSATSYWRSVSGNLGHAIGDNNSLYLRVYSVTQGSKGDTVIIQAITPSFHIIFSFLSRARIWPRRGWIGSFDLLNTYRPQLPITVAAQCKAWTAFVRSGSGVVGSDPTRGMFVCVRLFCVCVVLCVGIGLATGWFPFQGVLSIVKDQRIWKSGQYPKGCSAIKREREIENTSNYSPLAHCHTAQFTTTRTKSS